MSRRVLVPLPPLALAALLLAACGDDERVGPRAAGTEPAPPALAPSPRPTEPPAPAAPTPTAPSAAPAPRSSWRSTRAGDWATWEIRAPGGDAVTRVTWRATSAVDGRVEYVVSSRTSRPGGSTTSGPETSAVHEGPNAWDLVGGPGAQDGGELLVDGRRLPTRVHRLPGGDGESRVWTCAEVPFSGLVRSEDAGLVQTLVGFGRGG